MSHDWLKRVKTAFSKTFPFTHPSHRLERRDHIQRKNEKENMVEEGLVLIPSLKVIYHCYYSIDKRKTVL